MFPMAQELRIGGQFPRRRAGIFHIVVEADGILAALENESLGDRQSLTIAPGQRHTQFVGAGLQRIGALGSLEVGQMRRGRHARASGEPALQQV